MAANQVLMQFKAHPEAWSRTDRILEFSQSQELKFLALSILMDAIKTRWKTFPKDQREGIKNYLIQLIFKLSGDEVSLAQFSKLLNQCDETLVEV